MFAARAALLTKQSAGGGPTLTVPDELHWDITAASAQTISTSTSTTAPTGQDMKCINIGSAGRFSTSSIDGVMVYNSSNTGSSYLATTNAMPALVQYMAGRFRFNTDGATGTVCSLGLIIWKSLVISGDLSSCHLVVDYNAQTIYVQAVTAGGATFTTIGGPWSVTMAGNTWYTLEYVVNPTVPVMALKLPDGSYQHFGDSTLASIPQFYPCWEPFYAGGLDATDPDPEVREIWASTVVGASDPQLAYMNAILTAAGGQTNITRPPAPATNLGSDISGSASVTTTFTHTSASLLVALPICFSSNTIPSLESGWTDVGISQGLNTISGRPQYKLAANSSAETCTFTVGQDATHTTVVGFDHGAIGAADKFCSSLANIATPALTLQVTDGSSRVLYGYVTRGTLGTPPAAPAGSTRIEVIDNNPTGGDMAVYLTDAGVSSWPGATLATGTASGFYSWAIEIKAV